MIRVFHASDAKVFETLGDIAEAGPKVRTLSWFEPEWQIMTLENAGGFSICVVDAHLRRVCYVG